MAALRCTLGKGMKSIDNYLTHLHQQIVDALQRQPHVLGRFATLIYAVLTLTNSVLYKDGMASLALTLVSVTVLLLLSTNARIYASLDDAWWLRYFMLGLIVLDTIGMLFVGKSLASYLSGVPVTMFYYFATCRPPKPPERKHQFQLKEQT